MTTYSLSDLLDIHAQAAEAYGRASARYDVTRDDDDALDAQAAAYEVRESRERIDTILATVADELRAASYDDAEAFGREVAQ